MNKSLFILLLVFNVIALFISVLWVLKESKYEAYLAVIGSLAGLAGLYHNNPHRKVVKNLQHIEKVKNSGSINQAGRDIVK